MFHSGYYAVEYPFFIELYAKILHANAFRGDNSNMREWIIIFKDENNQSEYYRVFGIVVEKRMYVW